MYIKFINFFEINKGLFSFTYMNDKNSLCLQMGGGGGESKWW